MLISKMQHFVLFLVVHVILLFGGRILIGRIDLLVRVIDFIVGGRFAQDLLITEIEVLIECECLVSVRFVGVISCRWISGPWLCHTRLHDSLLHHSWSRDSWPDRCSCHATDRHPNFIPWANRYSAFININV
jgi:hypothetical protein